MVAMNEGQKRKVLRSAFKAKVGLEAVPDVKTIIALKMTFLITLLPVGASCPTDCKRLSSTVRITHTGRIMVTMARQQ
jgi:hypothetical protein